MGGTVKFALFSGSTPEWTPAELAAILKAQGWDGVEWRVVDQKPTAEVGFWAGNRATFPLTGWAGRAGEINAVTSGAGLEHAALAGYVAVSDREALEVLFEGTAAIGARRVRVNVPKALPGSRYGELFAQTRLDLEHVVARAKAHGVQALIQIHHGNILSTSSAAIRMVQGLDPACISLIHDLGNMTIEGREGLNTYTPGMEILGPYLAHVHVKNAAWRPTTTHPDETVDWSWSWAPLASGLGDVKGYFKSLKEVGYDGWVTVENFLSDLPSAERIAGDLRYLKAAAREAGYPV
jgi:sugar phosphate isomerase/epimerase